MGKLEKDPVVRETRRKLVVRAWTRLGNVEVEMNSEQQAKQGMKSLIAYIPRSSSALLSWHDQFWRSFVWSMPASSLKHIFFKILDNLLSPLSRIPDNPRLDQSVWKSRFCKATDHVRIFVRFASSEWRQKRRWKCFMRFVWCLEKNLHYGREVFTSIFVANIFRVLEKIGVKIESVFWGWNVQKFMGECLRWTSFLKHFVSRCFLRASSTGVILAK